MRKRINMFFGVICVMAHAPGFSQDALSGSTPKDSTSLYCQALKLHLEYLEKGLADRPVPAAGYWDLNIEAPAQITRELPDRLGRFRINYVNEKVLKAKIKRRRSLYLIRIGSAVVKDSLRSIGVGDFSVTWRKRQLWYGNEGGTTVRFKYDQDKESYVMVELLHGSL